MIILIFAISYLIGSISPAYILGKLLKRIDIRQHGSGNAGTMNSFTVLGTGPGIITLLSDFSKGIIAMNLAYYFGLSFPLVCIAGAFAIVGHVFPFYLNFKGGKGAATSYGIVAALLIKLLMGGLSWPLPLSLLVLALATIIITGTGNLAAFICLPLFMGGILFVQPGLTAAALAFFLFYNLILSIVNVRKKGGLRREIKFVSERKPIMVFRKLIRFLSLVIPLLYFWLSKTDLLYFVSFLLFVFLVLSLPLFRKKLSFLYKKNEGISGYVLFLLAALFTIIFFEKNIAILALVFSSLGDNFAVILGQSFGKKKILAQKTLEGSTACFASCFLAGVCLLPFLQFSLVQIAVPSCVATLIELISGRYDNLTIAPLTALSLFLL